MPNSFDVAAAPGVTTVWACRSWFCRSRGPFWVKSRRDAERAAREHAARRFLGLWSHEPLVCPPTGGVSVTDFLRKLGM
ncbi:MAG TPA: hypothetical protein VGT02_13635 [Methylomirabilota bacterium]|jgi:hypothetical protein|nr:hypothetical protein [Methylomirabilota bacterium]